MPDPAQGQSPPSSRQHVFQAPTGTRDLYPVEAARRRYITDAWRRVSINHGFEEIDGPTFEHLDLYKVKSGEGIVSELFSFTRAGGEKDYALRPEFTPTLARMYAAKAASLPKPTKWFTTGAFFRAERPQRGRLREFLQWNADVIGLSGDPKTDDEARAAKVQADTEIIACVVDLLRALGLSPAGASVRLSNRAVAASILRALGVDGQERISDALSLLDRVGKLEPLAADRQAAELGFSLTGYREHASNLETIFKAGIKSLEAGRAGNLENVFDLTSLRVLGNCLDSAGLHEWCCLDLNIARGLAYYTGTVFEVIADGERAVAGGGRYDNLIELFGGPPTPAVGFGMGDVVLANVLQDKGLMPSDAELMGLAGQRPDVFVISNGTPEADAALPRVLADLRRATPRTQGPGPKTEGSSLSPLASRISPGLHARRSYKTTRNVGKLLQDASKANARFAVIIESASEATIKDLATGTQDQHRTPLDRLPAELSARLAR